MKMKASKGGEGDYTPCPEGSWPAILVGLFDVGTHREPGYQGAPDEDVRKCVLVWEVHTDEAPAPWIVLRDYRLSFHEKAGLRKLIEGWRGKAFGEDEEFDLDTLKGRAALVQITHKVAKTSGNTYGRLESVMKLPKQIQPPTAKHAAVVWSVDDGKPFPALEYDCYLRGEPLADVVKRAAELRGGNGHAATAAAATAAEAEEVF